MPDKYDIHVKAFRHFGLVLVYGTDSADRWPWRELVAKVFTTPLSHRAGTDVHNFKIQVGEPKSTPTSRSSKTPPIQL